ncbi:CK1 family protein kinase [Tritrichomonas foetus]|uniref:non-specific serine/threonine protein kinase n=1 Tax=Tritrichomonas foetus TaxID=1144522 RepID=A0A1J4KRQ7_9EUKA|nr:CK1 family protein kinase [Tritrichomonas foetus]|eukprot:OHT13977.1 CK1 family protein kinase [Tritrichomonas foetus]
MAQKPFRITLSIGEVVGDYSILKLIGRGGYGDIYKVREIHSKTNYAMKIEEIENERQGLLQEKEVIQRLNSKCFPQIIEYGENYVNRYLVQELCGPSFSAMRKFLPDGHFSLSTVLRIGIEMLKAIRKLHNAGYIHRDIKPSNFLIRPNKKHPVALIDFGLCYQYKDFETGQYIDYESTLEKKSDNQYLTYEDFDQRRYVGTPRYMSLNAHGGKEPGRVDDLYSWFYSLIEIFRGCLPWARFVNIEDIKEVKMRIDGTILAQGMPHQMTSIFRVIRRMNLEDDPDYDLITSFLVDAMKSIGAKWDDPYEWEVMDISSISSIPFMYDPNDVSKKIPENLPEPVLPSVEVSNNIPEILPRQISEGKFQSKETGQIQCQITEQRTRRRSYNENNEDVEMVVQQSKNYNYYTNRRGSTKRPLNIPRF